MVSPLFAAPSTALDPAETPAGRTLAQSVAAVLLTLVVAGIAYLLSEEIHFSASILFVPVILAMAIFGGIVPSLVAALAALVACSFLFYEPFTLPVSDPQEYADLVVFAGVAIVSSQLADFARRAAAASRHREAMIEFLLAFNRRIGAVVDPSDTPRVLAEELAKGIEHAVALYVEQQGALVEIARSGDFAADPAESARAVWRQARDGRAETVDQPTCYVLRSGGTPLGVVALAAPASARIDPLTIAAMMEQAGSALARMQLALSVEEARLSAKAEDLREAVLGSISHDLHTPLASILGSVTTLEKFGPLCDDITRTELQSTIREEAERLERYIRRMLDLTRIRAGRLMPQMQAVDVADIANAALRQTQKSLARHRVETRGLLELPMVETDPVLIEQALVNILENAAKYSQPGTLIRLQGAAGDGRVVLSVQDAGIGLQENEVDRIFAPFYRADASSGQVAGNGLGLMVSKAFVEATGCEIWAESRGVGEGTIFRIGMPPAKTLMVADEGEAA